MRTLPCHACPAPQYIKSVVGPRVICTSALHCVAAKTYLHCTRSFHFLLATGQACVQDRKGLSQNVCQDIAMRTIRYEGVWALLVGPKG